MTDFHIHILPGIDDGSDSAETSEKMLEMLKEQGIERIVATPHFYAHRSKTVEHFLEKRQRAYEMLGSPKNILLGAEVAIERGISQMKDIEKLAVQDTDLILLEFPYTGYAPWMEDEIYNIGVTYGLKPVIAHIHRYIREYSKEQLEHILNMKAIFQVNNEAFGSFSERRFVKKMIKDGYPVIFGSDSHNTDTRRPNWDLLRKKAAPSVIDEAEKLLEKHIAK